MIVISYGIPKSGSTLAYEQLRGILTGAGHEQEILFNDRPGATDGDSHRGTPRNFLNLISRERIEEMIARIGPDRIIAVKTHSAFPVDMFRWLEERQAARDIQVIASYRDPRDICLSLLDAGARARDRGKDAFVKVTDLEKAMVNVQRRIASFRRWAALRGTVRLNYEDVAFNPDKAIDAMEQALGVKADRFAVLKYAFEDAYTQKNVAKARRHEDELSDEEKKIVSKTFHKFIRQVMERNNDRWFEKYRDELLEES